MVRPKGVPVWDLLFAKRHRQEDLLKTLQEETAKAQMAMTTASYVTRTAATAGRGKVALLRTKHAP